MLNCLCPHARWSIREGHGLLCVSHAQLFVPPCQVEYAREGLDGLEITYKDNKPVLDLFLTRPIGLLSLLDEQCRGLNVRALRNRNLTVGLHLLWPLSTTLCSYCKGLFQPTSNVFDLAIRPWTYCLTVSLETSTGNRQGLFAALSGELWQAFQLQTSPWQRSGLHHQALCWRRKSVVLAVRYPQGSECSMAL